MATTTFRQPLQPASPAKRNEKRNFRIFSDDDTATKPRARPRSRFRAPALSEVNRNISGRDESMIQDESGFYGLSASKHDGKRQRTATTPRKARRLPDSSFRIYTDPAEVEVAASPAKKVKFDIPSESEERWTESAQSSLTSLPRYQSILSTVLLSHSNPRPQLPTIPKPPPSLLRPSSSWPSIPRRTAPPVAESPLNSAPQYKPPPPPAARQPDPVQPTSATTGTTPFAHPPRPLNLTSLPSISHHTSHSILTLHPPTHVTLTLRATTPPTTYTITAWPPSVTVHDRTFTLPELPWKHLAAYRYARRFVEAVRKRTVVASGSVCGGVYGRVWADDHGVIEFESGTVVSISPEGSADGARSEDERRMAINIWKWLLAHPNEMPVVLDDAMQDWKIDSGTTFVKDVGWCREEHGKWNMRFLDGVRLVVGNDGEVEWWDARSLKPVIRTMEEKDVRRRVKGFVKAGL